MTLFEAWRHLRPWLHCSYRGPYWYTTQPEHQGYSSGLNLILLKPLANKVHIANNTNKLQTIRHHKHHHRGHGLHICSSGVSPNSPPATGGAKFTSLVSFWSSHSWLWPHRTWQSTNESLQVLQAHEGVLYLTIAEYIVPPALLKPLSVWVPYSPYSVMAVLHSTPATS